MQRALKKSQHWTCDNIYLSFDIPGEMTKSAKDAPGYQEVQYIQIGIYRESDATSCMQLFCGIRYSKLSAMKKVWRQPIRIF